MGRPIIFFHYLEGTILLVPVGCIWWGCGGRFRWHVFVFLVFLWFVLFVGSVCLLVPFVPFDDGDDGDDDDGVVDDGGVVVMMMIKWRWR